MNRTATKVLQDHSASASHTALSVATGAAVGGGHGGADALIAQTLLAGRTWVAIEHNGQHYRLQTTRAGKLILTK